MSRRLYIVMGLMIACVDDPELPGIGLVGDGLLNPMPSTLLMTDGRVDIPTSSVPLSEGGIPIDTERLAWREGFSSSQVAVVRLPGAVASGLPSWEFDVDDSSSVRLVDLTDGVFLPCFAELDANDEEEPSLLIRPQLGLTVGHQIAVVVTTEVAPRPARFDALISGNAPSDLEPWASAFVELMGQLEGLGVDPDTVSIAWDFPIGDGTAPLRSALAQRELVDSWTFEEVHERDVDGEVAPGIWRSAVGTFEVTDFLGDDQMLTLSSDGSVVSEGGREAPLYVYIPESVVDAPAGTVPVMLFGHGFLSEPDNYLAKEDDPSGVVALAEEGGFIVVSTLWSGLSADDLVLAVGVAANFGKFPELSNTMLQSQVNVRTLSDLVTDGTLLADPVFQGSTGQSLGDPSQLFYYGISLGGIGGSVFLSQSPSVQAGVLHVPGAQWSTMLERSSNWETFDLVLAPTVDEPADRQVLYSMSQLWWDPVDPMSYVDELAGQVVLFQEALGDEQVPNMTTRALVRSLGLSALGPIEDLPWGLPEVAGPLDAGSIAYVQYDPQRPLPPAINAPAPITEAHTLPRNWPGTHAQTLDFLDPGAPGTVVHHCGDAPCSASNPGE